MTGSASRRRERRTGVVLLPGHEDHETGRHPENAERLDAVVEHLSSGPDRDRLRFIDARRASEDDIARVHTRAHIDLVSDYSVAGPTWIDGDTVVSPGTYEVAMRASGAAMAAVDDVVSPSGAESAADSMFALIRPPGHHATADRAMGFCMFNHGAVAARYAQQVRGIDRVAILDWDVHHGNGTQDIFEADPSVLFVSLHQWPLYPGSGWLEEVGSGAGTGTTVNLPMPPGSGDFEHCDAFDNVVLPVMAAFDPGLVIVSAGQDGHVADPLSSQALTVDGFNALASRAGAFAAERGIGLVAVHEGGYNPETLPALDSAILAGFGNYPADLADPWSRTVTGGLPAISAHSGWDERLEHIIEIQRPYWPGTL
jgi:acetoin utilization deacetylase AcuC-like enzyme